MKVTYDWLVRHGACPSQREHFLTVFGAEALTGVEVNSENLERAAAADLDIEWLAHRLGICLVRDLEESASLHDWIVYIVNRVDELTENGFLREWIGDEAAEVV